MSRLPHEKHTAIIVSLANSIRATCRMTGAPKTAVTKLLVDLGSARGLHGRDDARP